jgi:hypothetical protein
MQFLSHLCALASFFLQSLQSFLPQFAEAVVAESVSTLAKNKIDNFFILVCFKFFLV